MGNCIHGLLHPCEDMSKVVITGEEEGEFLFKASTRVRKIIAGRFKGYILVHQALPYAPLPPNTKLEAGEVYYLMPPLPPQVSSKLDNGKASRKRKLKVVLTRQQLELLLGNSKQLKSKGIAVKLRAKGDRKWQPSLSAIPEVV